MSRRASPFDGLLGLLPDSLPSTDSCTVVVSGHRVTDPGLIDQLLDEDDPLRAQLRQAFSSGADVTRRPRNREKTQATRRAWYQANRAAVIARSHAWYWAHRDSVLAKAHAERQAAKAKTTSTTDERKDA